MNSERLPIGAELKFGRLIGKILRFVDEIDEGDGRFRLPYYEVEVDNPWGKDVYEVPLRREIRGNERTGTNGQ